MFSFVAVIFVCSSSGLVCQETITYTKHIENFAQQSDIFAAQSKPPVSRQFCMLRIQKILYSNQNWLLQLGPFASRRFPMLSIRKTLFRIQIFCCKVSCILKDFDCRSAFSAWQLLQFSSAFQIHLSFLSFRASDTLQSFWWLSPAAWVKQKYSKVSLNFPNLSTRG